MLPESCNLFCILGLTTLFQGGGEGEGSRTIRTSLNLENNGPFEQRRTEATLGRENLLLPIKNLIFQLEINQEEKKGKRVDTFKLNKQN